METAANLFRTATTGFAVAAQLIVQQTKNVYSARNGGNTKMCEDTFARCIDTIHELHLKLGKKFLNDEPYQLWLKKHPCIRFCRKFHDIGETLEFVKVAEEKREELKNWK